ncbi:MAG: PD-(D/E)XK nuclease superfamily protein [Pseudanabaenaceae cyanobacterium]|jgi:hypothetical protein
MKEEQGGAKANREGLRLQEIVLGILNTYKYEEQPNSFFRLACHLKQPIFSQQFDIGKGIYQTDCKCDFIIYHPEKHPQTLVIECKWQASSGSTDEKFPYMVANIKERFSTRTIIVIDGDGARKGGIKWLKNQVDQKYLIGVFSLSEFTKWANAGNL